MNTYPFHFSVSKKRINAFCEHPHARKSFQSMSEHDCAFLFHQINQNYCTIVALRLVCNAINLICLENEGSYFRYLFTLMCCMFHLHLNGGLNDGEIKLCMLKLWKMSHTPAKFIKFIMAFVILCEVVGMGQSLLVDHMIKKMKRRYNSSTKTLANVSWQNYITKLKLLAKKNIIKYNKKLGVHGKQVKYAIDDEAAKIILENCCSRNISINKISTSGLFKLSGLSSHLENFIGGNNDNDTNNVLVAVYTQPSGATTIVGFIVFEIIKKQLYLSSSGDLSHVEEYDSITFPKKYKKLGHIHYLESRIQNCGIGNVLLLSAMNLLKQKGCDALFLYDLTKGFYNWFKFKHLEYSGIVNDHNLLFFENLDTKFHVDYVKEKITKKGIVLNDIDLKYAMAVINIVNLNISSPSANQ